MRIPSINVTDFRIHFAGLFLLFLVSGTVRAEECSIGRGLASNDIVWLTGSGDTLWMITQKDRALAFNMIAGKSALSDATDERNWWSYTLGCKEGELFDLSFGSGLAVASFDTAPNMLWTYDHSDERIREVTFQWPARPADIPPDSIPYKFVVNDAAVTIHGYFLACMDGGLVRWNREENEATVCFPGSDEEYLPSDLEYGSLPEFDTTGRVTGVEVVEDDSLLIVTTPERLWFFSVPGASWDGDLGTGIADDAFTLNSFEYVFVNTFDRSRPLYAILSTEHEDAEEDSLVFCKYNRSINKWEVIFDRSPKSLSFGPKGFMYALFNEERPGGTLRNIIQVYRDTLGDSAVLRNPGPVIPGDRIHKRMIRSYDIDVPDAINDILYIPKTDSSGYLWIATSEGLFLSPDEVPGSENDDLPFELIKLAPSVSAGLKKTYARPGILTPYVSTCKFIYNIAAREARVTIKVYDYNMDLVKTVVENRPRLSGDHGGPLGRSTVESEDSWDGTNSLGRPVAPGPYYYKITTDSGERAFGKIVVAR